MPLSADALNRLNVALGSPVAGQEVANIINNPSSDSASNVFTGTGNITMSAGQKVQVVNKASGAATTVTLPASPTTWQTVLVKDGKGDASVNNITIQPAAGNIDGNATFVMNVNYGAAAFIYNGTQWNLTCYDTFAGILFQEPAADTITAFAGGGQANATLLSKEVNRITTVATAGDSVKLPVSAAGLTIVVINHGANACQVYGSGTDTIDDVATATGVSQMVNSVVIYFCTTAGAWYTEGLATGWGGPGLQTLSISPSITAFAGGGQASATPLTSMINRLATVASQGDSVRLPTSVAGLAVMILNRGAQPAQVFGAGTDTINGIATATGISQGVNTAAVYVCSVAGNWEVPLTSLQSTTPQVIGTAAPALPPHVGHTYVFNRAGVTAATLAAPTAGTDDGIEITVTSDSAQAHTITATGLLDTGTASVNVATFAAQKGAGLTMMAFNGRWKVLCSVGITFS